MNLRIKEICKQKNTSVSDLAVKMGIKQESLSRAINGNPQLETLEKIAAALNVPVTELFQYDETGLYGAVIFKGKTYRIDSIEALEGLYSAVKGL